MLLNKTINEAFEVILKQALFDDIDREFNQLKIIEDIPYSHKYKENINKIHNIYKNQIRKKQIIKITPKIALSAASVALIISISINPHVQAFVMEIFERVFGKYTQYEFYSDIIINQENFNYDLKPQYIPNGFKLKQVNYMTTYTILRYENEDDVLLIEYAIANKADFLIDNEHSVKSDVLINKNISAFYESTDSSRPSYLIWVQNGYCFMITAQIEFDNFVNIAESINFD